MKAFALLLIISASALLAGCGNGAPLPDTSNENHAVAPGTKTKDVLMPINK